MKKALWLIGALAVVVVLITGSIYFNDRVAKTNSAAANLEHTLDEGKHQVPEQNEEETEEVEESKKEQDSRNEINENIPSSTNEHDQEDAEQNNEEADDKSEKRETDTEQSDSGSTRSTDHENKDNKENNDYEGDGGDSHSESEGPKTSAKTVAQIKSSYESTFQAMENTYTSKLDALVQEAYDKYMYEGIDENDVEHYKGRARSLESEADANFYSTYEQLKNELENHGHNPQEAARFQEIYEQKKAQRRADLEQLLD